MTDLFVDRLRGLYKETTKSATPFDTKLPNLYTESFTQCDFVKSKAGNDGLSG